MWCHFNLSMWHPMNHSMRHRMYHIMYHIMKHYIPRHNMWGYVTICEVIFNKLCDVLCTIVCDPTLCYCYSKRSLGDSMNKLTMSYRQISWNEADTYLLCSFIYNYMQHDVTYDFAPNYGVTMCLLKPKSNATYLNRLI